MSVVAFRHTFTPHNEKEPEKKITTDTKPRNCSELRRPTWNQISLPVRNVCENHARPRRAIVYVAKLTSRALFYSETTNNHCAHLSTVSLFLNSRNWGKMTLTKSHNVPNAGMPASLHPCIISEFPM